MQARLRTLLCIALGPLVAASAPAAPDAPDAGSGSGGSDSALYAGRVTAGNAGDRLVGGPDAIGGIGDWALGNGTLCAVVSDPAHETVLSPRGGVLVDLGHCGRDDDQWNVLQPLLNASRGAVPGVEHIDARVEDGRAIVETLGVGDGIELETAYILDGNDPDRLRIRTRARRTGDGTRMRVFADVVLHGNGSLSPFSASTRRPGSPLHAPGFAHAPVDPEDPLAMVNAMVPSDLHVWVGADAIEPGVAYGLQMLEARRVDASGAAVELPIVSINGESFSLLGVLTRPFWLGGGDEIGLLELAQAVLFDLSPGDTLEIERALRVGRRADVASVTDGIHAALARVSGRVDDAAARLHVVAEAGGALTFVRPEPDGRFGFRAPAGRLRIEWSAPGGRSGALPVEVPAAGEVDVGAIATGAVGRVALPRGHAMRLVFQGTGETPDPLLRDDLRGFRLGEQPIRPGAASNDVALAGVPTDPAWVALAPGLYRVFATRGPEFDLGRALVDVRAGETTTLEIEPPMRVLETPGWLSADLHLHSLPSDDSTLDLESRVRRLVAAGLDVALATEHDRVADYGPVIARLGLEDRLASAVGSEVTTTAYSPDVPHTSGHANVFPMEVKPLEYQDGALAAEGRRLRGIRAELDALGGARVLQLNHPRAPTAKGDRGNYFEHLAVAGAPFDPTRPLDSGDNALLVERDPTTGLRDIDFDAVELMNGPSLRRYGMARADWLSLLLQGHRRTATANSDSHRASEVTATPRNYLPVADDRAGAFHDGLLVDAVKRGALYGTTGPLLEVDLSDTGLGGLHVGREGRLRARVRAAPWVPVSELRVFVDGEAVYTSSVEPGATLTVPLRFEADAFVSVEVEGRADKVYGAVLPGFTPFAFTNPIFVDADADGQWTAPGLPDRLPAALSDPLAVCGEDCGG
ncbi:MAG: CehA/McbA family metallohydrolase [Myxococcota bacterium]